MTFQQLVNDTRPVLVDFTATWCGPCQVQAPILQELASHYGDRLRVLKIDVDKNQALAQQQNVQGVPTLMLYQEGKLRWRQSGVASLQLLQQQVDQVLKVQTAHDNLYGFGR